MRTSNLILFFATISLISGFSLWILNISSESDVILKTEVMKIIFLGMVFLFGGWWFREQEIQNFQRISQEKS